MSVRYLPSAISLQYSEDLLSTLAEELVFSPKELSEAQELVFKGLPPLVRPEVLAYLFGVSNRFLYSMCSFPEKYYRVYQIKKTGGGTRQIEAPRRFLKLVQRWINRHILSTQLPPPPITGFVQGKNIFSNAKPHLLNKNLMVLDIEDFFPSVHRRQIYKIFTSFGYSRKVANLLTGLCTYDLRLPQGAPTSPSLANLAFKFIDLALIDLAKSWDCVYTRYADDIAFSGNMFFSNLEKEGVRRIIEEYGFSVNERKCRIIGSGGRQMLAGLVVNISGLPLRSKRRSWRAMFHQASMEPSKYTEKYSFLKGIASYVNEYNTELASEYFTIAKKVSELRGSS
jgi:RNA-directed DNA polymerase